MGEGGQPGLRIRVPANKLPQWAGPTSWKAVLFLHLLAVAFFVGGQLVFGIAVAPILRGEPDPECARMRGVARRFGYGSLVALGVTGWAMASHYELWDSSTCSGSWAWSPP